MQIEAPPLKSLKIIHKGNVPIAPVICSLAASRNNRGITDCYVMTLMGVHPDEYFRMGWPEGHAELWKDLYERDLVEPGSGSGSASPASAVEIVYVMHGMHHMLHVVRYIQAQRSRLQ